MSRWSVRREAMAGRSWKAPMNDCNGWVFIIIWSVNIPYHASRESQNISTNRIPYARLDRSGFDQGALLSNLTEIAAIDQQISIST
jgi:hypothetical protein